MIFSCTDDATFPSFSNIESLKFIISHRITHELTTRAVAIFLREIMDFDKPIEFEIYDSNHWETFLISENGNYVEDKAIDVVYFYELMSQKEKGSVVNLGVWQTAENRDFIHGSIHEGNSISSDIFRHGLYVPDKLTQNIERISYKNFVNTDGSYKKTIKTFSLRNEDHLKAFFYSTLPLSVEKVNHMNVKNGIYRPTQCNSTTEPCGIVLTSHYIDNYFFIRIIEALKLKMEVYFMGDKLKRTIYNLSKIIERNNMKKSFLVLHWTPSEVIDGKDNFTLVEMPPCQLYRDKNPHIGCKLDMNTVSVIYQDDIVESSPFLDKILKNIRFKSLKDLIEIYDERYLQDIDVQLTIRSDQYSHIGAHNETRLENIYNEIACKYMQKETEYYDTSNTAAYNWFENPDEFTIAIGGM